MNTKDKEVLKKEYYNVWCPHCNKFYDVTVYVNNLLNKQEQHFIKMIKEKLKKHRGIVCCPEDCFCWDIDNVLNKLKGEK